MANVSVNTLHFYPDQVLRRQVVDLPLSARIERISYIYREFAGYYDAIEFSDGTWLSYAPEYGWRYFYRTGPLFGLPVEVEQRGFAQPSFWRGFVQKLAQQLGISKPKPSTDHE